MQSTQSSTSAQPVRNQSRGIINRGTQWVQDVCLINIVTSAILSRHRHNPFIFDWSLIGKHSTNFTSEYNYEDARCLLQLSMMVTNSNFTDIPLNVPNWLVDIPIVYETCPIKTIAEGISNSPLNKPTALVHILYSERGNLLLIVFTGTSNACLATIDLNYYQTELEGINNYLPNVRGHQGVYIAYQSVRPKLLETVRKYIDRKPKIIITGHSLGGALSSLCTLDLAVLQPLHYSFAAPLIFNPKACDIFTQLVKNSYRIANLSDLVVLSPLPIMPNKDAFCHVGRVVLFQRNLGEYSDNHSLAYLLEYNIPYTELKSVS